MASQSRAIIWLECHHKISITRVQLATLPGDYLTRVSQQGKIECPFCPDAPAESTREQKSAQRLYKEAGEP
jgi:hypothetical protein